MRELDTTNQKLIALLRADARLPVAELAKRLGLSRATVQNRMHRLQSDGVILGFTLRLTDDLSDAPINALMSIECRSSDEAAIIDLLRGNPNVGRVHHTTGRWDLIAEIHADSLSTFNQVVGAIRRIDGVTTTESNLLLESYD
ncbi:MAG: Lrp/AsnC family transcriptional regulator [Pseudomonadota bacterium]